MSLQPPSTRTCADPGTPVRSASLVSLIAFPLALLALLAIASYPIAAIVGVALTVAATKTVQTVLAALIRRSSDRPRHVSIPGVGDVTISVSPA